MRWARAVPNVALESPVLQVVRCVVDDFPEPPLVLLLPLAEEAVVHAVDRGHRRTPPSGAAKLLRGRVRREGFPPISCRHVEPKRHTTVYPGPAAVRGTRKPKIRPVGRRVTRDVEPVLQVG